MQSREEPLLFEALGILQDSSESQMGVSFAMFSEPKIDTAVGDCGGGCNSQCDSSTQKRDSVVVRSVSFKGNEGVTTVLRSVSLEGGESSEATILKSASVRKKMVVEGSVGFKKSDSDSHSVDTNVAVQRHGVVETESTTHKKTDSIAESFLDSPKHDAAVKLQKVYRSFRTRRNLADCAVLVNQLWWMALDFATLKLNSVSFFDIDKPESAVSRWSRARVRAAMVGRGLSKDEKAQKLALQHWLEAIDPRHRYGHNLHFYYDMWLDCDSKQPFFYWLDIGEGKEFNIAECPRCRLQQQCIMYLGPNEREAYEVIVREGKFVYRKSGKLLDTSEGGEGAKWIFVLSTSRVMYVGQKKKGTFQHSSFLAGGATSSAGRLVVLKGILKSVWPYSGHYRPTEHNFQEFVSFLEENGVDLSDVKKSPEVWEEEISLERSESLLMTMSISSESDLSMDDECEPLDEDCVGISETETSEETSLEDNNNTLMVFGGSPVTKRPVSVAHRRRFTVCNISSSALNWREDESEEAREQRFLPHDKRNLFDEEEERAEIHVLRKESILQRINSKKGIVSYQLGKQLSCKWTTGAGPRIGFVRDHPSELRCRALEQVHLSPRSTIHRSRFALSPRPTLE